MLKCPPLPKVSQGQNAVNNHIDVAQLYRRCQNKVAGWIDWYTTTEGGQ